MSSLISSKPVTYSLTLEELGTEVVHKYQGREPSGRMFNEIVLDHNSEGQPSRGVTWQSDTSKFHLQTNLTIPW